MTCSMVRAVVLRIAVCQETGNPGMAETVWAEFKAVATPAELDEARRLLGR